jgi:hypothetical protein
MKTHFLLFSWEKAIPIEFGYGEDLNPENLCKCKSLTIIETPMYQNIIKTARHKNKSIIIDLHIVIQSDFESKIHGKVTVITPSTSESDDSKLKYDIIEYVRYRSLQIGKLCYDNIHICKVDTNIFV